MFLYVILEKMPLKLTNEQNFTMCKICIEYLSENRCLQEKSLFRTGISFTDVRALQNKIQQLIQTQDIAFG